MSNPNLEVKRRQIENCVKVAALLVVGFFVSPFIVRAIGGLIGAGVAAVVGLVAVNIAPSVAALIATWRLKALKAVAAANPIETLELNYADRQAALLAIRENITKSYSVLQNLYSQIQEHNRQYPNSPSQFLDKYQKLKSLVELRGKKYKEAQVSLEKFAEVIEEKRSDWKIAQTMAEASKLANVGQDFQSKLMQDTALNAVQDGLNMAFAELDTSLLDEQSAPATAAPAVAMPRNVAQIPQKISPPLDLGFDMNNVIDAEIVTTQRRATK